MSFLLLWVLLFETTIMYMKTYTSDYLVFGVINTRKEKIDVQYKKKKQPGFVYLGRLSGEGIN